MFIDTHCHLTDNVFSNNINSILENAKNNNIGKMICASAHPDDFKHVIQLSKNYNNIYCTIGIHPDYTNIDIDYDEILKICQNNKKIVAIGECGLDYYEKENISNEIKHKQHEMFTKQIELAKTLSLPVVIHTREASLDTENILKTEFKKSEFLSVMHCYTGSWESAKILLDMGFYFSASGIITFKNAERVREVFKNIPLDRIVIETDSPYCTPVPYRGTTNEPAYVIENAKTLAQIKNLDIYEIENILYKNTNSIFKGISFS